MRQLPECVWRVWAPHGAPLWAAQQQGVDLAWASLPLGSEVAGPFLSSSLCCPQLISSKVPKAEYIPTIIRRDDPSIIPILYVSARSAPLLVPPCRVGVLPERGSDLSVACSVPGPRARDVRGHPGYVPDMPTVFRGGAGGVRGAAEGSAHSPFSPEEIEKKLNGYHKGAKIWKMLIFCQVGLRTPAGLGVGGPRVLPPGRAHVRGVGQQWVGTCVPPAQPALASDRAVQDTCTC